eukprot:scaffold136996_cov18-Prasinocladus_malaysianus.AAC.1
MDATIMEFVWQWNCDAGVASCGDRDYGTYALEILDDLVPLQKHLWGTTAYPEWTTTPHIAADVLECMGCGVPAAVASNEQQSGTLRQPQQQQQQQQPQTPQTPQPQQQQQPQSQLQPVEANDEALEHEWDNEFALQDNTSADEELGDDTREMWFPGDGKSTTDFITSLENSRQNSGKWLAQKQGLPTLTTAIRTEDEVALFVKLLPQFESSSGRIDHDGLTTAFNDYVYRCCGSSRTLSSSTSEKDNIHLKTSSYIKDYCDTLKKRMILQKSCAGWVDKLKAVRRSLRDDSYCRWTTATDLQRTSPPGQGTRPTTLLAVALSAPPASDGQPSGVPSSLTAASALAATSAADSAPTMLGASAGICQPTGTRRPARRAEQKCGACNLPRHNNNLHIPKYGWCVLKNTFSNKTGKCALCKRVRVEDLDNHAKDGFCKRMNAYPNNRTRK